MKYWLLAFSLIGIWLRLSHPLEIEFKGDERFMLQQAISVGRTLPWPQAGMPSGVGLKNPPLSIWSCVALSRSFGLETPQSLSLGVAAWNALGLLALSIWAFIKKPRSLLWILGLSLAWVSPQALLLERQIWAQSLLPGLMAWLWMLWPNRHRRVPALALGLGLGLSGQIHMSGFFLATAVAIPILVKRTQLGAFLAGMALSVLPLIPWLSYLASPDGNAALHASSSYGALPHSVLDFWRHLVQDAFGSGLEYSLGAHAQDFFQDLRPLHLILRALQVVCVALCTWNLRTLPKPRWDDAEWILPATTLAGVLLLIPGTPVYRHYLLITYPAAWLLFGLLIQTASDPHPSKARHQSVIACLALGIALLQSVESAALLEFLEKNRGAPGADFGVSLRGLLETGK